MAHDPTTPVAPESGAGSSEAQGLPAEWKIAITPFATAIGKSPEEVTTALQSLIGQPTAGSVELLRDEECVPFDELFTALGSGIPKAVLKKAVKDHLRKAAAPAAAPAANPLLGGNIVALPTVPEDSSWLEMLKTGGVLKVDTSSVIAAIRAALASRTGLFDLPKELVRAMEHHAEGLEEPLGQDFFKLRNLVTKRSYADLFAAIEGLDGQFVTETRKNALLAKLDTLLWPALLGFQHQLEGWTEAYQKAFGNPATMMAALAAFGTGQAMIGGMTQPPPTDTLRDSAEGVRDKINQIFAGAGIQVAAALGYDAMRIREVLANPLLPAQVGAPNRETMLKLLKVNVSSDFVRLERNLTQYALAVLEFPNAPAGNGELGYLNSMLLLGGQIPWSTLAAPPRRDSASRLPRRTDHGEEA